MPPPTAAVPFRNWISVSPSEPRRQTRSLLPSPLKSPLAAICQLVSNGLLAIGPPPSEVRPLRNWISVGRSEPRRQPSSGLAPPLKSPLAATCQPASNGLLPRSPPPTRVTPRNSWIATRPSEERWKARPASPAPPKSPIAAMLQLGCEPVGIGASGGSLNDTCTPLMVMTPVSEPRPLLPPLWLGSAGWLRRFCTLKYWLSVPAPAGSVVLPKW